MTSPNVLIEYIISAQTPQFITKYREKDHNYVTRFGYLNTENFQMKKTEKKTVEQLQKNAVSVFGQNRGFGFASVTVTALEESTF